MVKGIKILRPQRGRRIVIGDIHGCFRTFQSLIEDEILLTKEDQLFLLGDYIDKGKRSKEVLDYIFELIKNDYSVYPLMGNHEYFVTTDIEIAKLKNHKIKDLIGSKDLLDINGEIPNKYLNFIHNLPYFYELDEFLLVHAGLDFTEKEPLEDTSSMIYIRDFKVDKTKIGNKILIHGHTPIGLNKIKRQIKTRNEAGKINLDNGCVYKNDATKSEKNLGSLCGLDLDQMKLYALENID